MSKKRHEVVRKVYQAPKPKESRRGPISEKELLRELNIKDWRHMTKDKIIGFANSLPYLDPEVAKTALNQFPRFSDMGTQVVKTLGTSLESIVNSGDKADQRAYEANKAILESLRKELDKPIITPWDRKHIIDSMVSVSNNIAAMNHDHKMFLDGLYRNLTAAGVTLVGVAGTLLGVNLIKKK